MIPQPLSRDAALADIRRRLNDLESSPDLYGATITGSVVQTDTTDIGFKITTDGIRQYDGTGAVVSSWTDDGIDLQGATLTGGSINGAIVTGGTVQTADSGPRIEITQELDGWQTGLLKFHTSTPDVAGEVRYDSTEGVVVVASDAGTSDAVELRIAPSSMLFQHLNGANVEASLQFNSDYLQAYCVGIQLQSYGDDVVLTSSSKIRLQAGADVTIMAGSDATSTVALVNIPSKTGVSANIYMDPTTGKLSRIA